MTNQPQRRTWFTTLLGVAAILLGGLGSLFSAFALLLAIGKPYANSASDPLGIFLIFILPPATLLAGFGLLIRQRWARWWMILLMAALAALGVKGLIAPSHQNPAYAPKPGPATEALQQRVIIQSTACITVGGLILLGLLSTPVRREFREPDYEYAGGGTASSHVVAPPAAPPALPSKSDGTILPMLGFLISIAIVCFWFAAQGIRNGETRLPARFSGNHRVVQTEKPTLFWTSIGLLGSIGTTSTAAAAWLVLQRIRTSRRQEKGR